MAPFHWGECRSYIDVKFDTIIFCDRLSQKPSLKRYDTCLVDKDARNTLATQQLWRWKRTCLEEEANLQRKLMPFVIEITWSNMSSAIYSSSLALESVDIYIKRQWSGPWVRGSYQRRASRHMRRNRAKSRGRFRFGLGRRFLRCDWGGVGVRGLRWVSKTVRNKLSCKK